MSVVRKSPTMALRCGSLANISRSPTVAFWTVGRCVSRTRVRARHPSRHSVPMQRKLARIPVHSARKPPSRGPSRAPVTCDEKNRPMAQPECSFGVSWASNGTTAAWKPDRHPCRSRSATSCQTACANDMPIMMRPSQHDARRIIGLRPYRSARRPHIGEKIARLTKLQP